MKQNSPVQNMTSKRVMDSVVSSIQAGGSFIFKTPVSILYQMPEFYVRFVLFVKISISSY